MNQIIGFVGFRPEPWPCFRPGLVIRYAEYRGWIFSNLLTLHHLTPQTTTWHAAPFPIEKYPHDENSARRYPDELQALVPLLIHSPVILDLLTTLISSCPAQRNCGIPVQAFSLAALMTSRINGSVACFNEQAYSANELVDVIAFFARMNVNYNVGNNDIRLSASPYRRYNG